MDIYIYIHIHTQTVYMCVRVTFTLGERLYLLGELRVSRTKYVMKRIPSQFIRNCFISSQTLLFVGDSTVIDGNVVALHPPLSKVNNSREYS